MQEIKVTLTPTPSPKLPPQTIKQPSPEPVRGWSTHRHRKRRSHTKASQGDAVLVGYMANQNAPDIAARAGEEPLNSDSEAFQDEADDQFSSSGGVSEGTRNDGRGKPGPHVRPGFRGSEEPSEHRAGVQKDDLMRPALGSLLTKDLLPPSREVAVLDATKTKSGKHDSDDGRPNAVNGMYHTSTGASNHPITSTKPASQSSSRPSPALRRHSSGNSALRKFAIPPSEASRMETLPAMQNPPPSLSATTPKEQQTLPPLHAHLGDLVDGNAGRPNGLSPGRSPYQSVTERIRSPLLAPMNSRPGPFTSPQPRMNGPFSPQYPSVQFRPLPHSDPPPRGPYRRNPNAVTLSPPAGLGASPYYPNGRTVPNEERTTAPTESYPNARPYGTDLSPSGDRISIESTRPPLQPPPATQPAMAGSYKCEHSDCKAPPFQTQYLLK